jgi:hypothetical protein
MSASSLNKASEKALLRDANKRLAAEVDRQREEIRLLREEAQTATARECAMAASYLRVEAEDCFGSDYTPARALQNAADALEQGIHRQTHTKAA